MGRNAVLCPAVSEQRTSVSGPVAVIRPDIRFFKCQRASAVAPGNGKPWSIKLTCCSYIQHTLRSARRNFLGQARGRTKNEKNWGPKATEGDRSGRLVRT